jgi:hypothetical protein
MRTTVDIGEDVLAAARTLAAERGISLGSALTELARRGLAARAIRAEGDLPVFDVPPGAPPITPSAVKVALEE